MVQDDEQELKQMIRKLADENEAKLALPQYWWGGQIELRPELVEKGAEAVKQVLGELLAQVAQTNAEHVLLDLEWCNEYGANGQPELFVGWGGVYYPGIGGELEQKLAALCVGGSRFWVEDRDAGAEIGEFFVGDIGEQREAHAKALVNEMVKMGLVGAEDGAALQKEATRAVRRHLATERAIEAQEVGVAPEEDGPSP